MSQEHGIEAYLDAPILEKVPSLPWCRGYVDSQPLGSNKAIAYLRCNDCQWNLPPARVEGSSDTDAGVGARQIVLGVRDRICARPVMPEG